MQAKLFEKEFTFDKDYKVTGQGIMRTSFGQGRINATKCAKFAVPTVKRRVAGTPNWTER